MSYTIRYNRTASHIEGIEIRTASSGDSQNFSRSTCPALSRGASRMAVGKSFEDLSEALEAAKLGARVAGRKMCAHCETAAS